MLSIGSGSHGSGVYCPCYQKLAMCQTRVSCVCSVYAVLFSLCLYPNALIPCLVYLLSEISHVSDHLSVECLVFTLPCFCIPMPFSMSNVLVIRKQLCVRPESVECLVFTLSCFPLCLCPNVLVPCLMSLFSESSHVSDQSQLCV